MKYLKKTRVIRRIACIAILIVSFSITARAQGSRQFIDTIEICTEKNSYIKLSGMTIKHLDMGGEDNILFLEEQGVIKLKAQSKNFTEKNFLVIGTDTLVQFLIRYNPNPKQFLYSYNVAPKPPIVFSSTNQEIRPEPEPEKVAAPAEPASEPRTKGEKKNDVKSEKSVINPVVSKPGEKIIKPISGIVSSFDKVYVKGPNTNIGLVKNNIKFRMTNLAVDKQHLYFVITITNNTQIEYNIDYLNFEVRSKGKMQETGMQSIYPEYKEYSKNKNVVNPDETVKLVYALDKFYLRDDEILTVSVFEKSSASKGRQYMLNVFARDFQLIENLN